MQGLLEKLLRNRGVEASDTEAFLSPDYERDLHDPFLMRDMARACERVFTAIDRGERVVVYADYDCDGIPGAVILNDFFKKIGYQNFEVYIPHRHNEGYGLNADAIEEFKNKNIKLIITIDLGITAVEEVELANSYGIDVIVTDHHLPHEILPKSYAILNPKVDSYPEKMLCGSGVVFKFVQGLIKFIEIGKSPSLSLGTIGNMPIGWEKWLLDMAGLATLSDMVPLLGENRAIAYFGLKVLRKSPRPGLQKLLAKLSIDQKYLSEDDVGFMITPRINAASRMDDPMRAYELLSTDNVVEAGALANHLSNINDERKHIVLSIMKEVKKTFEHREMREVVVLGNPKWRVGVLGLVAGKVSEQYKKPVFVWGRDENDKIKGSCRSDGSVSVVELMTEASEHFAEFGGHELAGGFTVVEESIHFLEEHLSNAYHKVKRPELGESEIQHDMKLNLADVNLQNWREVEKLAPFGLGNPKPVFLFEQVKIEKLKKFGKNGSGEHLEITFRGQSGARVAGVSFFSDEESFKAHIVDGGYVNLYAHFDLSRFRGRAELRLRIVDII